MAKNTAPGTALAVYDTSKFLALSMPPNEVREIIKGALGDEGISTNDLERIRIPAGGGRMWAFNTVDGEVNTNELNGIIIAHRQVRAFWPGAYTGEKTPPQCYSDDAVQGHGDPGILCDVCPNSKFGTANAGKGAGQACKLVRLVFMLLEGSFLPVVLSLPPTSQGIAKKYITQLAANAMLPWHVITSVTLEGGGTGKFTYSVVNFKRAYTLDADQRGRMQVFAEELRPAIMRTRVEAADYASDAAAETDVDV